VNVVSFVDRDMVMRYFGGGIGHLKNAPSLQVPGSGFDLIDPCSDLEGITVEEDDRCSSTNEDLGTVVQQPSKDVMNGELVQLENDEDDEDVAEDDEEDDEEDEDDSDGDEDRDRTDVDVDEEGEDDYGYASA
jgi:hypothetical protein